MPNHLDMFFERLSNGVAAGIGRKAGSGQPLGVSLGVYKETIFLTDSNEANQLLESEEFESHLLSIRPELTYGTTKEKSDFSAKVSDVGRYVKERLSAQLLDICIPGLNNEPQGFSPSIVVSTIEWIYITYAQELYVIECFSEDIPLFAHDLVYLLDLGHMPCGWERGLKHSRLHIY